MVVVIWLIAAVVVVVFIAGAVFLDRQGAGENNVSTDVLVRLYTIRKRMDVALFRLEARHHADKVRRELREELGEHGRRR